MFAWFDISNALVGLAGLATAIAVGATIYSFKRSAPSSRIVFKEDGRTEQFLVTSDEAEKLRAILERDLKRLREKHARREQRSNKPAGAAQQ